MRDHIIFIADLHLSESTPHLTDLFLRFMQQKASQASELYILGDLFEFWIGDDENTAFVTQIKNAIRNIVQTGVSVYFQHGNRDFLIGNKFAQKCGLTLLPSYHILQYANLNILLCHGDTLCIDDHRYQRFRKIVHSPLLQRIFKLLPLKLRVQIANNIRQKSTIQKRVKSIDIMDVNNNFTQLIMARHNTSLLIHGHTHKEAEHKMNDNQYRLVLGDWKESAPYLSLNKLGIWSFEEFN